MTRRFRYDLDAALYTTPQQPIAAKVIDGLAGRGGVDAVPKREEGVRGDHRAGGQRIRQPGGLRGILGLAMGSAARIHPAHLPGPDADGGPVLDVDHRIRLDVFGDGLGDQQIRHFPISGRLSGHHLQLAVTRRLAVARLHQQAAGERAYRQPRRLRVRERPGDQQP